MKENKISIEITADGWKTDVTINGKTYSERHIGHYGSSECVEEWVRSYAADKLLGIQMIDKGCANAEYIIRLRKE